ncbi:MAG: hypothetical protein JWQ40_3786 [Segetibacter sp.]|nr:hypothetical protein [Segetibacter sp.]
MAKVFTITPGLENMGAMKTGGQGSVYKGRRIGEIITAIKLLPTPIYSESEDDKNFRDFQNEVQKLKKVNEEPNPNVVKILSSGLSETGNFPFIEMEYIEGPDLEELLKPPHDPIFTVKEVIKVAEQLANALAHCHKQDVRHGDIKSNNVKFNLNTGNYILLDFGLAIMSDEQRRTSLRKAGAVEFMAPEQNEGQMLFQTDVYSFGIIIFELLAGRVPFPLSDKGETARNTVRLAHMETPPPDVMFLRQEMLPKTWSKEKREREMQLPEWLVKMIYKCLQKNPENRFINGVELHEYILHNSTHSHQTGEKANYGVLSIDSARISKEREQLQQQLLTYSQQVTEREKELSLLRATLANKENEVQLIKEQTLAYSAGQSKKGVSKTAFIALLLITLGLAAYSGYSLLKIGRPDDQQITDTISDTSNTTLTPEVKAVAETTITVKKEDTTLKIPKPIATVNKTKDSINNLAKKVEPAADENTDPALQNGEQQKAEETTEKKPANGQTQYMVTSRAYFYNEPNESTKRGAFIIPSNTAIVTALDEKEDFIYVVFSNEVVKTSGWLRKKDLQQIND